MAAQNSGPSSADIPSRRQRLVVLISGGGTNLQALLDAARDPAFPAEVVAVGSDRADATGLERAARSDVPTFVVAPKQFPDRAAWDESLAAKIGEYQPDWVVSAGFMRLLGSAVLNAFPQRIVNTHPSLLPTFPGASAVRDALSYGVKVTGCTIHLVDAGIDTGPIIAQQSIEVLDSDDEDGLHERIKTVERRLLVDVIERLCHERLSVSAPRKVSFQ